MNDIDLLERAFPAPAELDVERAQERVLQRYRGRPEPRAPRRSRRALLTAGVGLAAAAALILLALDAGRSHDSSAVARTLNGLARVAAGQAAVIPGSYAYSRTRSDYGGTGSNTVDGHSYVYSYHTPALTEQWSSASGDIIRCEREGAPRFKTAADRQAWLGAGSPDLDALHGSLGYERFLGTPWTLAGATADRLPTTVEGIAGLVQTLKYHDAGSILENVLELLGSGPVSPAANAALFGYLATVPGLTVEPRALTHGGRLGIGVSVAGNGLTGSERWVDRFLIFDPATSRLIGYRELSPGTPPTQRGGDRAWSEYLAQGSVTLQVPPVPKKGTVQSSIGPDAVRTCAGLARP